MTRKHSANALAAKQRNRLASPPPDYFDAPDYSKPVREIVYRDLLSGETHIFLLFIHPRRVDQFVCLIDGKPWLAQAGWSRVLAGLRKAVPRFSQRPQ
jgi:hypothetical protein